MREMSLDGVNTRVWLEDGLILRRKQDTFGMDNHADGTGLAIGRARIFADLRDFRRDQVALVQRAAEFKMQLWKA
jgi:hypothetical protein